MDALWSSAKILGGGGAPRDLAVFPSSLDIILSFKNIAKSIEMSVFFSFCV
jgi:hypothetical protein